MRISWWIIISKNFWRKIIKIPFLTKINSKSLKITQPHYQPCKIKLENLQIRIFYIFFTIIQIQKNFSNGEKTTMINILINSRSWGSFTIQHYCLEVLNNKNILCLLQYEKFNSFYVKRKFCLRDSPKMLHTRILGFLAANFVCHENLQNIEKI